MKITSPPFFIVGVPRSGTSLLAIILNNSSLVGIPPETHYFDYFYRKCKSLNNVKKFNVLFSKYLHSEYLKSFDFTNEDEEFLLRKRDKSELSHANILEELCLIYIKKNKKKMWGEKTPSHAENIDLLLNFYNDAKIVHIIRDPRDVILSLNKVPWGKGGLISKINLWMRYIQISNNNRLNNKNYYEIKYEDLLTKPLDTIMGVCKFLKVPFENSMLDYYKAQNQNFNVEKEPWKIKTLEKIDSSNYNKWKNNMKPAQISLIQNLLNDEILNHGYELESDKVKSDLHIYYFCLLVIDKILIIMHYIKRCINKIF